MHALRPLVMAVEGRHLLDNFRERAFPPAFTQWSIFPQSPGRGSQTAKAEAACLLPRVSSSLPMNIDDPRQPWDWISKNGPSDNHSQEGAEEWESVHVVSLEVENQAPQDQRDRHRDLKAPTGQSTSEGLRGQGDKVGQQHSVTHLSANTDAGTRHQHRDSPSTERDSGYFTSRCAEIPDKSNLIKSGSRCDVVCL